MIISNFDSDAEQHFAYWSAGLRSKFILPRFFRSKFILPRFWSTLLFCDDPFFEYTGYTQRGNKFYFWQPQVATWGYSHSTPSGLCFLRFFLIDLLL